MELEIQKTRENPLMNRTEVHFVLHHPNSQTPKRDAVRDELSKTLKVPKERVIVDHMKSAFGVHDTKGYAKIYPSKEEAMKIESEHLLVRNRLKDKKVKKAGEPAAAAAPAKEA